MKRVRVVVEVSWKEGGTTAEQCERVSGGVRKRGGESRCTQGKTVVRGLGGSKGKVMGGVHATAGGTVKIILVKQR